MFQQLGFPELIIILLIVLLLFGARKLPDLARSLGKSIGEFKKGREEIDKTDKAGKDEKKSDSDEK
jgi:sec-independent protein translocase protein TatA